MDRLTTASPAGPAESTALGPVEGGKNLLTSLADLPEEEVFLKMLTEETLKRASGNKSVAARMLGINRSTLAKRIVKYEL